LTLRAICGSRLLAESGQGRAVYISRLGGLVMWFHICVMALVLALLFATYLFVIRQKQS
jgi:hypothetical protein